jgi:archaellum component FlaC
MLGPVRILLSLPGRLVGMADDVAKMAAATAVLPRVVQQLSAIGDHVERLDREVADMHAAVERIRGDVIGVEGGVLPLSEQLGAVALSIDPLATEVGEMRAGLERLEAHLAWLPRRRGGAARAAGAQPPSA